MIEPPALIPADAVAGVWDKAAPLLAKALDRQTKWALEDIRQQCQLGAMQLWVCPWDMALVTQIQTYPLERICVVVLCGGSGLSGSESHVHVIEDWAKAQWGVHAMEIWGRRGWLRALGYEEQATVMRKRL